MFACVVRYSICNNYIFFFSLRPKNKISLIMGYRVKNKKLTYLMTNLTFIILFILVDHLIFFPIDFSICSV
jgi:hypothetical protein